MATNPIPYLTPEQYLEIERAAEFRSEYWNGEMFAMAGATLRHNVIVNNIGTAFRGQLKGRCIYATTDLRLLIPVTGLHTYPDVMVVCGEVVFADHREDMITNPGCIIEVLSRSTAKYDLVPKFEQYRSIPSFSDYLAVHQDKVHVEHFTRQADNSWVLRDYRDLTDVIHIPSIQADLSLAAIYEE